MNASATTLSPQARCVICGIPGWFDHFGHKALLDGEVQAVIEKKFGHYLHAAADNASLVEQATDDISDLYRSAATSTPAESHYWMAIAEALEARVDEIVSSRG